jgi:hypothetical protein
LPRIRDIEAAIAAYNSADRERFVLPPLAAQLLAVMFPRDTVCLCGVTKLATTGGFNRNAVRKLLIKQRGAGRTPNTYRLHLPPRRQP